MLEYILINQYSAGEEPMMSAEMRRKVVEEERARKRKEKQEERDNQKKQQSAEQAFQKEWAKPREVNIGSLFLSLYHHIIIHLTLVVMI